MDGNNSNYNQSYPWSSYGQATSEVMYPPMNSSRAMGGQMNGMNQMGGMNQLAHSYQSMPNQGYGEQNSYSGSDWMPKPNPYSADPYASASCDYNQMGYGQMSKQMSRNGLNSFGDHRGNMRSAESGYGTSLPGLGGSDQLSNQDGKPAYWY